MIAMFNGTGTAFDCLIAQTVPVILGNGQLNSDIGGPAVVISSEISDVIFSLTFSLIGIQ